MLFVSYLHIILKISHKLIAAIRTIKLSYYCWYLFCVHASVSSNCVSEAFKSFKGALLNEKSIILCRNKTNSLVRWWKGSVMLKRCGTDFSHVFVVVSETCGMKITLYSSI